MEGHAMRIEEHPYVWLTVVAVLFLVGSWLDTI